MHSPDETKNATFGNLRQEFNEDNADGLVVGFRLSETHTKNGGRNVQSKYLLT